MYVGYRQACATKKASLPEKNQFARKKNRTVQGMVDERQEDSTGWLRSVRLEPRRPEVVLLPYQGLVAGLLVYRVLQEQHQYRVPRKKILRDYSQHAG